MYALIKQMLKLYEGTEVSLHAVLILALYWSQRSASRPRYFTLERPVPSTYWI